MPKGQKGAKVLSTFVHNGVKYKPGESVEINPDEPHKPPFVGKIKQILLKPAKHIDGEGDINVTVAWFYRPEEAVGGRKPFHGGKELFTSDHEDTVNKNTILHKVQVHKLRNYESLKDISDRDYFSRFSYKPATMEFEPDRVPVYCKCELPYNPDRPMIMCDACEEWYHLDCIESRVDHQLPYQCEQCKERGTA